MIDYTLMTEDHIAQIADLEVQCFSDPWSENSVRSELNNPLSLWIVACDDDSVVGYVGSQSVLGEADMMNLAVAPQYRRQSIANNLIEALVEKLDEAGVHSITLEVRVSNLPAIALYTKHGFAELGRRPNYYHNPKEDALILRKEW